MQTGQPGRMRQSHCLRAVWVVGSIRYLILSFHQKCITRFTRVHIYSVLWFLEICGEYHWFNYFDMGSGITFIDFSEHAWTDSQSGLFSTILFQVLECFHTYCQACLEKQPIINQTIQCPECQCVTVIASGGLSQLPSDCAINAVLEARGTSWFD